MRDPIRAIGPESLVLEARLGGDLGDEEVHEPVEGVVLFDRISEGFFVGSDFSGASSGASRARLS